MNGNVVLDPNKTRDMESRLIHAKGEARKAEMLAEMTKHPGWQIYYEKWEGRLNEIERELDGFAKMGSEARLLLLNEREILRRIVNLSTDLDIAADQMHMNIKQMEEQVNERKRRE